MILNFTPKILALSNKILRSRIPIGWENTTTAILTNTAKQFRLSNQRLSNSSRMSSRYAVVSSLSYAPHAEVVDCALSATPNSLKSLVGQNDSLKSLVDKT